jgi:hypothetical protein
MRPLCAPHSSRSAELSHSPKAVILRSKPGCDAREGDVQRHPPEDQRFSNTTHSRTGPPAQALSHCFANASGLASPRPRHSPNAGELRRKIPKRSCSRFILRHQSKILPALIGCRGPPSIHHISSDETLPKSADIVVIGGGIVGASAAYFLRGAACRWPLRKRDMSVANSRAGTGAGAVGRTARQAIVFIACK